MVAHPDKYKWLDGATLDEHSKIKHKIVREYFARYIATRCIIPHQKQFRLAICDGFSGGGLYQTGESGSPLIFLEELQKAAEQEALRRTINGMPPLTISCLLILNDSDKEAIQCAKTNIEYFLKVNYDAFRSIDVEIKYINKRFEKSYPEIRNLLIERKYKNVLFNLDQCGHSLVRRTTIIDIMTTFLCAEIFYTFMIQSLLTYLSKQNHGKLESQLRYLGPSADHLRTLDWHQDDIYLSYDQRLGAAEKLVFDLFQACAEFVSPFAVYNPNGWKYWILHFSNSPRAREVYNDTLHENSTLQAHYGRPGIKMLCSDPGKSVSLYLFDQNGRESARCNLYNEIPAELSKIGRNTLMGGFLTKIYKDSVSHKQDILGSMLSNPDIEIVTEAGGRRRSEAGITFKDTIVLKPQKSFSFSNTI